MSVCQRCGKTLLEQDRGRKRKWCSPRCRKAQYSTPCGRCGAPTEGGNGRGHLLCGKCNRDQLNATKRARHNEKLAQIVALRGEGLLNAEIAERLGLTAQAVASLVCRARKRGALVPATPYRPTFGRDARRHV